MKMKNSSSDNVKNCFTIIICFCILFFIVIALFEVFSNYMSSNLISNSSCIQIKEDNISLNEILMNKIENNFSRKGFRTFEGK